MNVTRLRFAVLLGALAVPAAARAQVERLAGRLDEGTRAAVTAVIDSVSGAGVPAGPLVNKALEGASKGADGERIVAAVRTLAGDLARARLGLGAAATEPELVAGAAALRAGETPDFLARLRRDYPRESLVVPLAVVADLVARGVPADTAAQSVLALMREGERDEDLVAFRQSVERDIALGAAPGGAASALSPGTGTIPGNSASGLGTQTPARPRKP